MKTMTLTLAAMAVSLSGLATAAKPKLAPPVVRKASAKPVPASARTDGAPAAASGAPSPAPVAAKPTGAPSGLAAAQPPAAEAALDNGLVTVVNRLIATGRCAEAVDVATANGAADLAARAKASCRAR